MPGHIQTFRADFGSISSASQAFASNVTAHSTIAVATRVGAALGVTSCTISDNVNAGNYVNQVSIDEVGDGHALRGSYMLNAGAGATTVSWVLSGGASLRVEVSEGVADATNGDALDQSAGVDCGSTGNPASGNITTTAPAWIFGGASSGTNTDWGYGSGWTNHPGNGVKVTSEERYESAAGTFNADFTVTIDNTAAFVMAFKSGAGAPAYPNILKTFGPDQGRPYTALRM